MRKLILGLLIVGGLIGLALLARLGKSDGSEVTVAAVEQQTIHSSILASGKLAYREHVQLRPEVIGKVIEVLVKEGDRVNKDDVVLRLDPETIRTEVEQQTANVRQQEIAIERQKLTIANLEQQWQRRKELFERGLLDVNSFDMATNELAIARLDLETRRQMLSQARAQLNEARERLSKTVIKSPMDGLVTGVFVKSGETVIAGTTNITGSTMLSIGDPSEILSEVNVDEADIANIGIGQGAEIHAAAYPDTPLRGTVKAIATTARTVEGRQGLSFQVDILLQDTGDMLLRPGMSCRAEIYTASSAEALSVPIQAVLYAEPENESAADAEQIPYVFVAHDGKAVKREVKLGIADDTLQEITGGLDQGEQVITGPTGTLRHLKDGAEITVAAQKG